MSALLERTIPAVNLSVGATKSPAPQGFNGVDGHLYLLLFNNGNCNYYDFNSFFPAAVSGEMPAQTMLPFPIHISPAGTIKSLLAAFISEMKSEGKMPNTLRSYAGDVKTVLQIVTDKYFEGKDLEEIDISQITREHIKYAEYQLFLESKKPPKTLDRLKHGWNGFCKHIGMGDWKITMTTNTTREYRPEAVSNADVVKMLKYCQREAESAKTYAMRIRWLRLEIMIGLGWGSGFRSCEYGNATFNEIINTGFVTIRNSKHNGTRRVPVTDETQDAVSRLKAELKKHPCGDGVFEKPDGEIYTTSTFRRWLKKVAEACNTPTTVAKTHGLRHRFAKNFHGFTKNELMLADLMGHKSIEVTRQYALESLENQRKAVQEANKMARAALLEAA